MAGQSGVSTRNRKKATDQIAKTFGGTGVAAQVGAHPGRIAYKYKNEGRGRVTTVMKGGNGKKWWDNLQILFNGLANEGRNPIFTTRSEMADFKEIWRRAINRSIRGRGSPAALMMGAKLVSRKLLETYRGHMKKGLTTGGKPARQTNAQIRQSKGFRARNGNQNYRHGPGMQVARDTGYGVDTGQLWDSFYVSTKKLTEGR